MHKGKRPAERGYRLDSIRMDKTYYTEEGYLVDHPVVTRCGIFEYAEPDGGIRHELRLPEEVFSEKSLASYEGKPIIISHDAGEIDRDNVHGEQIGTILSKGYRDGGNVRCKIVIHDTEALEKCGLRELSLGYALDLDETPGMYKGQPYDAVQRNIEVNHLALVREARAGGSARLNIDHKDAGAKGEKNYLKGGPAMAGRGKDGNRYDGGLTPEELEQAVALFKAQTGAEPADNADGEETGNGENAPDAEDVVNAVRERKDRRDSERMDDGDVIAEQEKDIEALLGVIDGLQAASDMAMDGSGDGEADAADPTDNTDGEETENTDGSDGDGTGGEKPVNMDSVDRMVSRRLRDYLDVCRVADRLNLDGVENLGLTEARKRVIRAVNPKLNLDGKTETYINAAYDIARQGVSGRKKVDDQRRKMSERNYDSAAHEEGAASGARERMIGRMGGRK